MSVEEVTIHHFLISSSASATTLLPGQDKPGPSGPMSRGSCVVVSCGVRWSEVGLSEIRKPQVDSILFWFQPGAKTPHRDHYEVCLHESSLSTDDWSY
jgi:hypothetical protein